jgi:hypothetical protein
MLNWTSVDKSLVYTELALPYSGTNVGNIHSVRSAEFVLALF